MHFDNSVIQPLLLAALLMWVLYRRIRRNFGRQPLAPRRMMFRMGLLTVIGCLLLPMAIHSPPALGALAAGLVAGVGLGLWGAAHTRFLDVEGQRFYVPHTYAGIAVTLIFVGRLAYRFIQDMDRMHAHAASAAAGIHASSADTVRNPVTLAVFFLLIGYYVCFYARVLQRSKHPVPADFEPAAAARVPQGLPPT